MISSSSRWAGSPEVASALVTLSEKAGLRNWTGETLTATLTSSGQEAASEQAVVQHPVAELH